MWNAKAGSLRALLVAALMLGQGLGQGLFGMDLGAGSAAFSGAAMAQETPGDPGSPGYPGYPGYPQDECDNGCGEAGIDPFNRPVRVLFGPGGRYEFVTIGPQGQAALVEAIIEEVGGSVHRRSDLSALGQTSLISTFPSMAARDRAQAEISARAPQSSLAPHHVYSYAQSRVPRLYAATMIGDVTGETGAGVCQLSRSVTIGMIDGPVNTSHPALRGADITFETLAPTGRVPDASHGTGVAVLLVGQDTESGLTGFARGARLHAISVFSPGNPGPETGVERIAQAIDRLMQSGVRLINMSFAGPENAALARAVAAAGARGAVLVAASGNNRRPQVAWPAAAPEVVAVTAVDAARRLFRMANTGAEIELSAPGVDVYTARGQGAGYVSGTSFAAPIVTAIAAREMAAGVRSASAIRARLRARAESLGPGERNTQFGWGLVQAGGC